MDIVHEKSYKKIQPYIKSIENGTLRAPISLHLFLTDWCVNVCNMCSHWKTENKKILQLETIERLWQEMNDNYGESVAMTGGDPVRHPQFNEILALPRKFDIGFVNTGNYQKDFDWELLRTVRWVRFSIDSLQDDRYKIIRSRGNLTKTIIPNIKRTQQYVKEVGINFTVQNINVPEVYDMIKWCADEGIYRLVVYPMHGDATLGVTKEQEKDILEQLERARSEGLWDKIPENNFQFLVDTLYKSAEHEELTLRKAAFDLEKHPCMITKIHLTIGTDGSVYPCCMIADDTDAYKQRNFWVQSTHDENHNYTKVENPDMLHTMGNVNDESMIEIWKRYYNTSIAADKCKNCWSRYQPVINAYHENRGKKTFI